MPLGEVIVLRALFTGVPAPTIEWSRNGEPLSTAKTITIAKSAEETTLTINKIAQSDEGDYSCRINNSRGMDVCKCNIEIEKQFKPAVYVDEVKKPEKKAERKPPRAPVVREAKPESTEMPTAPVESPKPAAPAVEEKPVEPVVVEAEPAPVVEEKQPEPVLVQKPEEKQPAVRKTSTVDAKKTPAGTAPAPVEVKKSVADAKKPVEAAKKAAPAPVEKKPEPKKAEAAKPAPAKKIEEPKSAPKAAEKPAPAPAPAPAPVPEPEPTPVVGEEDKQPEVTVVPEPVQPEPVVEVTPEPVIEVAPEPVVEVTPEPVVEEPAAVETQPEPVAVEAEPEPVAVEAEPEPVAVEAEPEPVAVEAEPEPVAVEAEPEPVVVEAETEAEKVEVADKPAEPEPVVVAVEETEATATAAVVDEEEEVKKTELEEEEAKLPESPRLGFLRHLKSQNLVESDALVLECEAQGKEPIELVWLRNGKEIPENPDFLRESQGNIHTLTVTEIFPEDSGVFSAELFNETTSQTLISSCSVVVRGRDEPELDPKFTQFPTSVNIEEGSPVRVECNVEGTQPVTSNYQD